MCSDFFPSLWRGRGGQYCPTQECEWRTSWRGLAGIAGGTRASGALLSGFTSACCGVNAHAGPDTEHRAHIQPACAHRVPTSLRMCRAALLRLWGLAARRRRGQLAQHGRRGCDAQRRLARPLVHHRRLVPGTPATTERTSIQQATHRNAGAWQCPVDARPHTLQRPRAVRTV